MACGGGKHEGRTAMANHDLVLRGGRVIDGTGAAGFSADIAIDGERITAVTGLPRGSGRRELDGPASEPEIDAMRARLAEGLEAGAVGLSTGLWYAPANAAPKSEIVALAELLRPAGAVYTTHMRDEAEHVLDSLEESFAVGREADVPVMISHHKVIGKTNFGRTRETILRLRAAIAAQPIGLDA